MSVTLNNERSIPEEVFYNTTLEVLEEGEKVLGGQNPGGVYSVSEFIDEEHVGGSFHGDIEDALNHMRGFNKHGPTWEDEDDAQGVAWRFAKAIH